MPRPVRLSVCLSVCPLLLDDTYQLSLTDPRATEPSFRQSLMVAVINYRGRGKYPYFWRYPNSVQHSVGWVEGSSRAKTSPIHSAVSIEHRLVTETDTDGQTQGGAIASTSTASRGVKTVRFSFGRTNLTTVDLPLQDFASPAFGTDFQTEVPVFTSSSL